jgi:hypothetical protein
MNLAEIANINHDLLCQSITNEFCKEYDENSSNVEVTDIDELKYEYNIAIVYYFHYHNV